MGGAVSSLASSTQGLDRLLYYYWRGKVLSYAGNFCEETSNLHSFVCVCVLSFPPSVQGAAVTIVL